jgi:hypothetical protein
MCIAGGKKSGNPDLKYMTSQKCKDSDDYKFVIDRLGKFMSKAAPSSCIAAKEDNAIT